MTSYELPDVSHLTDMQLLKLIQGNYLMGFHWMSGVEAAEMCSRGDRMVVVMGKRKFLETLAHAGAMNRLANTRVWEGDPKWRADYYRAELLDAAPMGSA